jgi:WhiB family redox-sensing transcriptional regulator
MSDARCVETDPELFFPDKATLWRVEAAKKICAKCDVSRECLAYALVNRFDEGIWGGLSPGERTRLLREARGGKNV